jgi:hypothetical protein
MPGLVPGIHVLLSRGMKTWMAGTSPAMTSFIRERASFPDGPKDQTRNDAVLNSSLIHILRNHRKIRPTRTGIDRFLKHLADQFRAADPDAGIISQLQDRSFNAYSVENARSGKLPGTIAFMP